MRGGAAHLAAAIRRAERECRQPACVTILLDGGDTYQGTAASNLVFGRSVVSVYNYLGYSAAALGNHEFDWGQDTLRALMKAAAYPILGANVRYKDGRDVPWIPNDTLIARGGFLVGIIGVSTVDTPVATWAGHVADLSFVDPVPIIDSIAPRLRARGAHFVIVVGHVGARCSNPIRGENRSEPPVVCNGEAVDIARKVTARIDAFVTGHSHTRVNDEINGVPIVQARSRGQAIDVVDLFPTGARPLREVREVYSDSLVPDADVLDIVANANAWLDKIAPHVNRPVARIASTLRRDGDQHGLGNLIADAMRVVGRGDVAIMNNGGIRQALPGGTVTYGTLFEVQPFGNTLVRVRVRGADLRAYFARILSRGPPNVHVSGTRIVYRPGQAAVIDTITVLGRPLNDQTTYTVVMNDFSANGGDRLSFDASAISTTPAGVVDIDAFIAYLKSLSQPVAAPADIRLISRP